MSTLDHLAAHGVIDFDADAYIKGTTPRYVGNPDLGCELPLERPLPVVFNGPYPIAYAQPRTDAFVHTNEAKKESTNPNWKKVLAGLLIAAGLIFGAMKLKNLKLKEKLGKLKENLNTKNEKIKNKFKRNKTNTNATTNASEIAENTAKKASKLKVPKWVKGTAIGAGVLTVLYGLYSIFTRNKNSAE